jgi:hypothetical protein
MNGQGANFEAVTDALLSEIQSVMGLAPNHLTRQTVRSIFGPAARRLANLLVRLDHDTANHGLRAAAENMLSKFVQDFQVDCPEAIPRDGPLLVVSNHPGSYDLLLLVASLFRDDLKIISSDIAIFRYLPSVAPHFIPITADPYRRMAAFRAGLRQLLEGKALLIFPRGDVEAEPMLSANAAQGIAHWSLSLDLFLRRAPRTCSIVAIVSNVFSPRWANHPILRFWKRTEQRQKIAQIIQVAEQLVLSKRPLNLIPRVSYSPPLIFSEVDETAAPSDWPMQALMQTARDQLAAINR